MSYKNLLRLHSNPVSVVTEAALNQLPKELLVFIAAENQLWSFTGRRDLQIVCELIGEFRKSAKSTYKFDFSVIS